VNKGLSIVCTPGTCSGDPRVEGTRITVRNIVRSFLDGDSHQQIAEAYDLDVGSVENAIRYHMNARRKR
jgi:uncharacterized protein (DUF433 family)